MANFEIVIRVLPAQSITHMHTDTQLVVPRLVPEDFWLLALLIWLSGLIKEDLFVCPLRIVVL